MQFIYLFKNEISRVRWVMISKNRLDLPIEKMNDNEKSRINLINGNDHKYGLSGG